MKFPRVLGVVTAAMLSASLLTASPSLSVAAPGPHRVGPHEFHAIHRGMTPQQLQRAVHGADYTATGPRRCRTRVYRGWNPRHYRIHVVLEPIPDRVVTVKAITARDESVTFTCAG